MGKTKTAFVGGVIEEKLSSEEKYKQKLAKKKAEAAMAQGGKEGKAEKVKNVESFGNAQDKLVEKAELERKVEQAEHTKLAEKEEKQEEKAESFGSAQDGQAESVDEAEKDSGEVKPGSKEDYDEAKQASEENSGEAQKKKVHVRGKNYIGAKAKVDTGRLYKLTDAIKLIRSLSYAKFDETFELHLVVKKQGININTVLPHHFGKSKKVEIASDSTVKKLQSGKIDFDLLLATAEMMPKLVPFARLLGPKGLMPNPKNGTLIKNEKEAEKFSTDQKTIKTEKDHPVIHTAVAKMSMKDDEIEENVNAVLNAITKIQIAKCYIKSTMSPALKLQV